MSADNYAAIGFRIKSGWATALLLKGPSDSIQVLDRRRVELCDPADPELRQPYHADFGVEQKDATAVAERVRAIERYSRRSLSSLIAEYRRGECVLSGAGLVVGSDVDPDRIANQHIRAHAREGRLFRRVVEEAMERERVPCSTWIERTLYGVASARLGRPEADVKRAAAGLGRGVTGGWRSDDKVAAVAAWMTLAAASR